MKITALKTYIMDSPGRDYVFVKVETDEGLYGWGEGTLEMKQGTVAAAVRDLEGFLLGEDPTRVDFLWQRLYRHSFWRGGEAVLSAISALEQALWDITGKAYGQPVYRLLGGPVRDYIPCYTHTGDPERAQQLMAEGWRAFKFGPPGARAGQSTVDERQIVRETARIAEALRRAVGDEVLLLCDCHGRFRPPVAIRLGRALEPYDLFFLEEPVPPDNLQSVGGGPGHGPGDRGVGLHQVGLPRTHREPAGGHHPARRLPRRRHQGAPENRGAGRDLQHRRRPPQPQRTGQHRRQRPRGRLSAQLRYSGVRALADPAMPARPARSCGPRTGGSPCRPGRDWASIWMKSTFSVTPGPAPNSGPASTTPMAAWPMSELL